MRIRLADRTDKGDFRMDGKRLFNRGGVEIVATPNDRIFCTAGDYTLARMRGAGLRRVKVDSSTICPNGSRQGIGNGGNWLF